MRMKSIWGKLALKISLVLIVVLTIIGVADVYQRYQQNVAALQAKEERILQQLSLILGSPVYNIDYPQIEKILSIYLQDQDVLAINIVEHDHVIKSLGKASPESQELVDLTQQTVPYPAADQKSAQILHEEEVLATVTILFSRQTIHAEMQRAILIDVSSLVFAIISVSLMVLVLMKTHVTRHLWYLIQVAQQVAVGNVNVALNKDVSNDEIGQLHLAIQHMIAYIKNATSVAEQVARQQLQVEILPASDHDVLNHSLQKMVTNLQAMIAQNAQTLQKIEHQNWLNEGLNQLNANLLGQMSLAETCQRAISFLARYVNAGRGVLYLYDAERHVLTFGGSFAFTEDEHTKQTYRLGEGVIGQVALERRPIVLKNLSGKNYRIHTGIVSESPNSTYTVPLIYNKELYGALELASYEPFDDRQQHFLHEASQVTATVIFSALQRERVQELLRTSEQAILEAENAEQIAQQQREEAQKANAQLKEQQQQLQQQSEEMRQINAHLEEQQQQLQQQSEELRQQNEHLNQAKEELVLRAKQMELVSQERLEYFANMSHELQGPIQSITLLSGILSKNEKGTFEPHEVQQLAAIYNSGQELLRLLNNMLELRKIEAGALTVLPARFSSADVLANCQETFQTVAQEKGVNLIVQDELRATLETDQEKIAHILQNLLSIAFRYTTQGSVTLNISPQRDKPGIVQFSISDTGTHVPREKYQIVTDSAQGLTSGVSKDFDVTELEFAIASAYAKLLKGTLEILSQEEQGNLMILSLPANPEPIPMRVDQPEYPLEMSAALWQKATVHGPEMDRPSANIQAYSQALTISEQPDLAGKKILIADDDMKNVFVLASALENQGATVVEVHNGKIALDVLRQDNEVDMLLLDIMMPVMDGYATLREIRGDERLKHLPVIVLTAKTLENERQRCLEAGADEYVSKPVDHDAFIRLINTWVKRR
ncbi:multi-sensor hybrid histidine kinase [Candidatus Vecturithrix granuli]|uniref:histidine kinase n=1 Tax=Vecturithrix granuli TaxID=1499967 RepID=A0A081C040_VECG1|nr:multi-sensor hybrid histidine kinase [Candidatus Vecturithrix granuli]